MIELPDTNYASKIADWIELYILYESRQISKNKILSLIEDNVGEVDESKVDSALQELNRRLILYGKVKPYKFNNNIVVPNFNWEKYPELTMCLLFSTYGASNSEKGTKLFEQLTKSCIDFYFNCESINFGFPAKIGFKAQLDNLANRCFESRKDNPKTSDKDRGVDIVAWKAFDDTRNSNLYLLIQCATGSNYTEKSVIPFITSWSRYISWNYHTTVPAISITQIIESDKWQNAVDQLGVILDRARLFRTITTSGYKVNQKLRKQIKTWCKSKLT